MAVHPKLKGRYTDDDLKKIIGRAQELYNREKATIDHAAVDETAAELDIPERYVDEAERALKAEDAVREKTRPKRRIIIAVGAAAAAVVVLIIVVALVMSTPSNRLQSARGQYYNRVVVLDEAIKTRRAQVENVIERRFELIPKLTELVRGYARSDKEILLSLDGARNAFGSSSSLSDKTAALDRLDQALSRITRTAQSKPDMKNAQLYRDLMAEIAGSDNRIAVERKRYNDTVGEYNAYVRQYPLVDYIEALGFAKEQAYWNFGDTSKAP